MKRSLKVFIYLLVIPVFTLSAQEHENDDYVGDFLEASEVRTKKRLISRILKSELSFEEIYSRLKEGREYSQDVAKGKLEWDYKIDSLDHLTTVFIPNNYIPELKYKVHIFLHGGVSNPDKEMMRKYLQRSSPNCDSIKSILIYPSGWSESLWWSENQLKNIQYLVKRIKNSYNVDENNIHFSGFSDGATAVYFFINHMKCLWATAKPYVGNLGSTVMLSENPLYLTNFIGSNFLIFNTEFDQTFRAPVVMNYIQLLQSEVPNIEHYMLKGYDHSLEWYKSYKPMILEYVDNHKRNPFPDTIFWQTDNPRKFGRCYWLSIDKINYNQKEPLEGYIEPIGEDTLYGNINPKPSGRVKAISSRNSIMIETEEIKQLTLFLSPEQFDFDSPVEIFVNGKLHYKGFLEKNKEILLKRYLEDIDRSMLFANEFKIKIK